MIRVFTLSQIYANGLAYDFFRILLAPLYRRFEALVRRGDMVVQGRPEGIYLIGGRPLDRLLSRLLSRYDKLSLASLYREVNVQSPQRRAFEIPNHASEASRA